MPTPRRRDDSAPSQPTPAQLERRAVAQLAPVLPMLQELGGIFSDARHQLALVGGPVRDAFLGRTSGDLDLTTSARPDQIEALLKPWADTTWDIGRDFGTIGARRGDAIIEVTTYRADAYDRKTRKPVVSFGDSLTDDLVRRDFTVNAMALRLPELEFVDPYDGLGALAARLLQTPSSPEISFGDDPLRMMRAARFAAQLGFVVAPVAKTAMTEMASSIGMISAERVHDELVKLMMAPDPRAGLTLLVDTGIADHVLPELPALRLERDEHHRHKDVYQHSLTVLEQAMTLEGERVVPGLESPELVPGPDLVLRLAALLHDIGKPATRRFEKDGGVSFHHHEMVGAKLVRKRLRALRFDKDTIKQVARLTELHLRFHGYGGPGMPARGSSGAVGSQWTDSAVRRYITDAGPLLSRLHLLTRSDCTTRNRRKAAALSAAYDSLEVRIAALREQEELDAVRPELNGNQIADTLGIEPGPVLGRAYKHLLTFRLDNGPVGEDAARAELLRWWADQPESAPDRD